VRLPRGWAKTSLAEIALINPKNPDRIPEDIEEVSFIPMASVEAGTGRLHTDETRKWGAVKKGYKRFQDGDVLFAKITPCMENGKTALAHGLKGGVAAGSTEYHVLRPTLAVRDKLLMYYLLQESVRRDARAQMTGTAGQLRVPRSFLEERALSLPPLPEQQRIVEAIESYLSRLDAAVALLERVQRNLKRYRVSVLKAAVEGRLVPTEAELAKKEGRSYESASELLKRILVERRKKWIENAAEKARAKAEKKAREAGKPWAHADDIKTLEKERAKAAKKYKEPAAPDLSALGAQAGTSTLPALPEGWCWATLPQLGELNRGKSKHRPRNDPRLLGGPYPFIQTGDVRHSDGFISTHEATYSEFGLAQSRLWPAGTLCITIAANIAETGILSMPACFPDSVVGFLNESMPTLTRFVEFFLRTAKRELERYAPATAQKNINLQVLSSLAIPLPPQVEQVRIVSQLDQLLSTVAQSTCAFTDSIQRANRLRQSILKWAFEGKLVEQDPNDLPAPRPGNWFVYALECDDGSIYIGQTENIEERWKLHARGKGAEWTKRHPPVKLVHWEEFDSLEDAVKREKELKTGFGRKWLKREYAAGRTRQAGEPASVLLERIKAERESMQPRKRRRTITKKKDEPTKHDEQLNLLGGSNR